MGARGGAPLLGWARRLIPMDMSVTHRREHDEGAGGSLLPHQGSDHPQPGSGCFPHCVPGPRSTTLSARDALLLVTPVRYLIHL